MAQAVQVVIPTLNEAHQLAATIRHTRAAATTPVRVVVSDCGSHDGTFDVARHAADAVVRGGTSRASAMNRAAAGSSRLLLFLHADTRLPERWDVALREAAAAGAVGGAFDFRFDLDPRCDAKARRRLAIVQTLNRMRFRCAGRFYGDQAIWVRRDVFEHIGGFPEVPLMEDARFCERLRRQGPTAILQPPVRTSPRRFVSKGVFRTLLNDLIIVGLDACALQPIWVARRYRRWNERGDRLHRRQAPGGVLSDHE